METLRIALVTLGAPTTLTGGYLYHLRLAELAPRHDARIDFVSFPEWPFPFPIAASRRVLGEIRALRPHVILLDSIAAAFLAPALWLGRVGVPVVAILHQTPGGIDHGPWRTVLQARLDKLAYGQSRRMVVASQDLATQLVKLGYPLEKLQVAAPGRDVAESSEAAPADLRQGRMAAFVSVANWVARKDLLSLLEGFAALPPDTATLHLIGDSEVEPDYAARVRQRLDLPDLRERVVYHGKLRRQQVAGFYAGADAFVLTSLVEPYGTVYGEAMAAGLPVAGWRAGNLPHLATHEREGLILEPSDIAGLTLALQRLASDKILRQRLAAGARTRSLEFPTWLETSGAVVTALRQVIGSDTREFLPLG